MGWLIDLSKITIGEIVIAPNPTHEYVAGVVLTVHGHGDCCVAIADVTTNTLVATYRLANPPDINTEDNWIIHKLKKWNISRWRYATERQHEARYEVYRTVIIENQLRLVIEYVTYNQRIGDLQVKSGFYEAHSHDVIDKRVDSKWVQSIIRLAQECNSQRVHFSEYLFIAGFSQIDLERKSNIDRIRYPDEKQSLIEAGILACIEMHEVYFTAVDFP